jgi:hypothetical protein
MSMLVGVRMRVPVCVRPHLHSNVEAGHVEALKHDLGGVLAVLRSVQRRLRLCVCVCVCVCADCQGPA